MAKVCEVTGKRPMSGNNVSHANNKTRRRFIPNLQKKRIWLAEENRYITLRLSTKGMRTIDKNGIENVLAKMKARKNGTAFKQKATPVRDAATVSDAK